MPPLKQRLIHSCGLRPSVPTVSGKDIAPNKKSEMNYESIKTQIQTLIADVQKKPASRIDAALEPIREDMLEARKQGVRLGELFKVIGAEAKDISPSSFAKYAQRNLQVKKQRRKHPAKPSVRKQIQVGQLGRKAKQLPKEGQPAKPPAPLKHENETKFQDSPEQPRTQAGKPRIARGNY
jgi:hypothetical protein